MGERIELLTTAAEHKKRLEDFLFDRFSGLSKMYLREIVKSEKCEVNGRLENVGYKLRANDFVEIELDPSRETAMRPQDLPLDIVFEDESLIVVNKAAGMLVHPTHRDKNGTLLNALAYYLNNGILTQKRRDLELSGTRQSEGESAIQDPKSEIVRPGLIHRLDKQTSGLIVVAKTQRAHRILADHFQRRLVEKRYLALVNGNVGDESGSIDGPIGRFAEQKRWDIKPDGKHAVTEYRVVNRSANKSLLELTPVTGRTNQLRIHCASIGHPIAGDTARGGSPFYRLCLHAHRLAFRHPVSGKPLNFTAEADFG